MIAMTFGQFAAWAGARTDGVDSDRVVAGIGIDSRKLGADHLFVALPGQRTHGQQYVPEAWAKGAVALVEEDFPETGGPLIRADAPLAALGRAMRRYLDDHAMHVVGVTGSVGKTSIKELIGAVLRTTYPTAMTEGNYNTAIGIPLSFFSADPGVTHFVTEMGMRARGEIRHLTEIAPPEVAVISNIGPSHLESLGSLDAIQAAKGEILEGLTANGQAVLNFDDPRVRYLGNALRDRPVLWYGHTPGLDASVEGADDRGEETRIRLRWRGRSVDIALPWPGAHHALNVAAAFLVGTVYGVPLEQIVAGLEAVPRDRSRIRRHRVGSVVVVEDDYNASPVSVEAALKLLAKEPGRRVAVLGDILELGPQEEPLHRQVGAKVPQAADLLLTVGPRARWIAEEAKLRELPVLMADDAEEAYTVLTGALRPGDVVLVKASRGMALEVLVDRLRAWGGPS